MASRLLGGPYRLETNATPYPSAAAHGPQAPLKSLWWKSDGLKVSILLPGHPAAGIRNDQRSCLPALHALQRTRRSPPAAAGG